jgi:hypothetical protein
VVGRVGGAGEVGGGGFGFVVELDDGDQQGVQDVAVQGVVGNLEGVVVCFAEAGRVVVSVLFLFFVFFFVAGL